MTNSLSTVSEIKRLDTIQGDGPSSIHPGHLVVLELGARNAWDARYEGPFEVTALIEPKLVAIERLLHVPGKNNRRTVNLELLRRYRERDLVTDELASSPRSACA